MAGKINQETVKQPALEIVQATSDEPLNSLNQEQQSDAFRSRRFSNDRRPWYKQLRWGDFLMYGLISIIAVTMLLAAPIGRGGQAQIAILSEDGKTLFSKPVAELQTAGSFTIDAMGFHYRIAYESGRIRFAEANCLDQVCVRTGWVNRTGQVAACVPGHLILKITGPATSGTSDVDIVLK